jgi:hypothetical protein
MGMSTVRQKEQQIASALEVRRWAIAEALNAEDRLRALGFPIESAFEVRVVTRQERRQLTKREPTTKI